MLNNQEYSPSFTCCNPNASEECKKVMALFKSIYGKHIITAQHSNSRFNTEFQRIYEITGQYPAMAGFDFLSVGKGAEPFLTEAKELKNNVNSIDTAIKWVQDHKTLLTFCWHWNSPSGYKRSHSFYKKFTDFDFPQVMRDKNVEYQLLIDDMDKVAEKLKILQDEKIPVLWRPLHEANGVHFWWGNDPIPYLELYHMMYDRFTKVHGLNNLIWVWNGHEPQLYPGDDCTDINGLDSYSYQFNSGTLEGEFNKLNAITQGKKPLTLSEISAPPDMARLKKEKIPWLWFMLWNGFPDDEKNNTHELIKAAYNHPFALTEEGLHEYLKSMH